MAFAAVSTGVPELSDVYGATETGTTVTITADNGPIQMTAPDSANTTLLHLIQQDTDTSFLSTIWIESSHPAGWDLYITNNSLVQGSLARLTTTSADNTVRSLVYISSGHADAQGTTCLDIGNGGSYSSSSAPIVRIIGVDKAPLLQLISSDSPATRMTFHVVNSVGPESEVTAQPGALCLHGQSGVWWRKQAGVGNTGWIRILDYLAASQRLVGRNSGGDGQCEDITLSTVLDWTSTSQGAIIYRGSSTWAGLEPGTQGQFLKTQGAGGNPLWANVATPGAAGGRLTLTSGLPVTTADVTAATLAYYSPYLHDSLSLFDGTVWQTVTFGQLSIQTTNAQTCTTTLLSTTLVVADSSQLMRGMEVSGTNIAALTTISSITDATHVVMSLAATGNGTQTNTFKIPASKNVDIFAVLVSGAAAIRFGNFWTNDTTRADALGNQNGYNNVNNAVINSGDSNSIAAKTGLYLGTIRTTATTGQTEDSDARRLVANNYNKAPRRLKAIESTASWTYTTATWREANGGSTPGVTRVQALLPSSSDFIHLVATAISENSAASVAVLRYTGIGVDSTTAPSSPIYTFTGLVGADQVMTQAIYDGNPGVGLHVLSWLEYSIATSTTTWYGNITGLIGWVIS